MELFVPETKRDPKLYLRFSDSSIRYIFHPTFSPAAYGKVLEDRLVLNWPEKTDQWCIHDGCPFDGRPVPIPLSYDPKTGRIEVAAGVCCSGSCLKRYLMDQGPLSPRRLAIANQMLTEVFGLQESIPVAPPRHMLKQYGGPFDLQEFRGTKHTILFREAPFIVRDMVYEEKRKTDRQQQAPAVFEDNAAMMDTSEHHTTAAPIPPLPTRKTTKKSNNSSSSKTGSANTTRSLLSLVRKN